MTSELETFQSWGLDKPELMNLDAYLETMSLWFERHAGQKPDCITRHRWEIVHLLASLQALGAGLPVDADVFYHHRGHIGNMRHLTSLNGSHYARAEARGEFDRVFAALSAKFRIAYAIPETLTRSV